MPFGRRPTGPAASIARKMPADEALVKSSNTMKASVARTPAPSGQKSVVATQAGANCGRWAPTKMPPSMNRNRRTA
ncbi:hypothetical protein UVI_02016870 [Ustilaginoidea virens]|uniref:Uncharacterized protein n=1 Tax=Ustilaginoidea virens TaxID=1159556 RepID=A0A1B5KYZ1_USTVR|nr:hypothetical protein UVI_02016870 [Ustilaginoidea virens]